MGGPPELDTTSSSEGTGQVTFTALRPIETNTLSAVTQFFLSPIGFKVFTIERALSDVAFYHISSSVALLDM